MQAEEVREEGRLSLTEQLRHLAGGDRVIAEEALRVVYPELRRIAEGALRRERAGGFSATELIHEMWLRKLRLGGWQIDDRRHFYALAAFAMRQVLIELARLQKSGKRGGAELIVSLDENIAGEQTADPDAVIQMGILMDQLDKKHPEAARIVDLYHFAGFTLQEIADITGLKFGQVRRLCDKGCNWIKDGLSR